jgi:hypothetical protein
MSVNPNPDLPTASEIAYGKAMTAAAGENLARLDAEANRTRLEADTAGWLDPHLNDKAYEARNEADLALEEHSSAAWWTWAAEYNPRALREAEAEAKVAEPELELD